MPTTEPKVLSIINELSSKIDVRDAPISAGVLLRLLIEFSVNNYVTVNSVTAGSKLHQKIAEAGKHMFTVGTIDKKQNELLAKMCKLDELLSAHTLNQYVHSSTYMPTGRDLTTFWDNIYFFLRACW